MEKPGVNLIVNTRPVTMNDFVKEFIRSIVIGMLASLKEVKQIKSVDLSFNEDEALIIVNSAMVPANPFVGKLFKNTITGMVTSLKGVDALTRLEISLVEH
jgi:hypothetical protein